MRVYFQLILFFLIFKISGQELNLDDISTLELKNSIRLNHIFIDQPDITYQYSDGTTYDLKPRTGILGLNYNIPLNAHLFFLLFLLFLFLLFYQNLFFPLLINLENPFFLLLRSFIYFLLIIDHRCLILFIL